MKNDLTQAGSRHGIALDIPAELLEEAGIDPGDTIILYAEQGRIIVRKALAADGDDCDEEIIGQDDCPDDEDRLERGL